MATFNLLGVLTSLLFSRNPINLGISYAHAPSRLSHLDLVGHEAIVLKAIEPLKAGRIRLHAISWAARCPDNITLYPGEWVRIVGRENITLLVEPLSRKNSPSVCQSIPLNKV